jgi:hypothetical protein
MNEDAEIKAKQKIKLYRYLRRSVLLGILVVLVTGIL